MNRKLLLPLAAAALACSACAGDSGHAHNPYSGGQSSAPAQWVRRRPTIRMVPVSQGSLQSVHHRAASRVNGEGYRTLSTRLRGTRGGAEVVTVRAGQFYRVLVKHF